MKKEFFVVHCVYFSACGTVSSYVHAYVSGLPGQTGARFQNWAGREDRIPLELEHDDILVFAMPVYGGFIPSFCAALVSLLHGSSTPAAVLAVYGNRHYDNALVQMDELLARQGFETKAAAALSARHSIFPSVASGRPDDKDREEARQFASMFDPQGKSVSSMLPGDRSADPSVFRGTPFHPEADESCTGCMRCVSVCPVSAISRENVRTSGKAVCISCGRCIVSCPAGARGYRGEEYRQSGEVFLKKNGERKENVFFPAAVQDRR